MTTTLAPVTNFDVTTSWIPVVTPWPLTEVCSSQIYSQPGGGTVVAFDPIYYASMDPTALVCLPPTITSWWFQSRRPLFTTSLGPFACPAAYSTVSASLVNAYTAEVFCCPSGYDFVTSCNWATLGQCTMTMTPGQILAYKTENRFSSWVDATTTIQFDVVTVYGIHVNGFAVSASTVASSTATTSGNTAKSIPSASGAAASNTTANLIPPTSRAATSRMTANSIPLSSGPAISSTTANSITPASEAAKSPSNSGLSSDAGAGIGVGVGIFVIIGILVALLLVHRRRVFQEKQANESTRLPEDLLQRELAESEGPLHELSEARESNVVGPWELSSQKWVAESGISQRSNNRPEGP